MAPGHIYLSTSLVLYLHTCSSVCRVAGDNRNGQKKIACGGVRRVLRVRPICSGTSQDWRKWNNVLYGIERVCVIVVEQDTASFLAYRNVRHVPAGGGRQAAPGGRPGCIKLYLLYNFPMSIVIRALDKSLQLRATC